MTRYTRNFLIVGTALLLSDTALEAQADEWRIVAEPATVALQVGASTPLAVRALDASGTAVDGPVRYAAPRGSLRVRDGVGDARQVRKQYIAPPRPSQL